MPSEDTQFKQGHSGRPKGAKNKLAKTYLKDLYAIYLEGGKKALKLLLEEQPREFVKLVAQLLPRDLDIKHSGDITVQVVNYCDDESVPAEKHNDLIPQAQALQQVM